ncbi:hypothetical protein CAL14_16375 [Bordetella genomosp. 9]|nr:hypothetical protein CAL14_16375 [Bordetella genomosp. 9]
MVTSPLSASHAIAAGPPLNATAPQGAAAPQIADTLRQMASHMAFARRTALDGGALTAFVRAAFDDGAIPAGPDGDVIRKGLADLLRMQAAPERQRTAIPFDIAVAVLGRERAAALSQRGEDANAILANAPGAATQAEIDAMREQWRQHVVFDRRAPDDGLDEECGPANPPAPDLLLQFAAVYLRTHPGLTPEAFFQPFAELAARDIGIPENLAAAFQESLPYETFRDWVDVCARQLPRRPTIESRMPYIDYVGPTQYAGWRAALAAISSPLAQGLMRSGGLTLDTLLSWTKLDIRLNAEALPGDKDVATPVALLLAQKDVSSAVRNPAALHDASILRQLADNYVPVQHAIALLSSPARWKARKAEIDRVCAHYASHPPDWGAMRRTQMRRRLHYFDNDNRTLSAAQARELDESRKALEPYEMLEALRASGKLDTWVAEKRVDAAGAIHPSLRLRPGSDLLASWDAQGIPATQQVAMGRFVAQGFDEAWSRDTVGRMGHAAGRIESWHRGAGDRDLGACLDAPMQAAVASWLSDPRIGEEVLAYVPAMIASDLGVERIDRLLGSGVSTGRLDAALGPGAKAAAHVHYGHITPQQLFDWVGDGHIAELALRETFGQAPQDVSPLQAEIAATRDALRRADRSMQTILAGIDPQSRAARHGMSLSQAWRAAIGELGALQSPSLAENAAQDPAGLEQRLLRVAADLSTAIADAPKSAAFATTLQRGALAV